MWCGACCGVGVWWGEWVVWPGGAWCGGQGGGEGDEESRPLGAGDDGGGESGSCSSRGWRMQAQAQAQQPAAMGAVEVGRL